MHSERKHMSDPQRPAQTPGKRSVAPHEAYNLFTRESVLLLDACGSPGPSLPGSAWCDTSGGAPLLQAAAAAREKVLTEYTPDHCRECLLLCDPDEPQRMDAVVRWLLGEEGGCRTVFCASRRALLESHAFLFNVDSVHALPCYPSEIIAGQLFLGSAATANEAALDALRITHVLSVVERELLPPFGRAHLWLPIADADDVELRPILGPALRFVSAALGGGGRVLVHCERGASRSVSVVCAHLMRARALALADALAHVKVQRPCAQPNVGFLRQLEGLDVGALLVETDERTACRLES